MILATRSAGARFQKNDCFVCNVKRLCHDLTIHQVINNSLPNPVTQRVRYMVCISIGILNEYATYADIRRVRWGVLVQENF